MYHYNDRFYESNCDSCKQEFRSLTIREMKTLEEFHECGISTESVVYADDYLVEFVPTAEFSKPMFTTKRF